MTFPGPHETGKTVSQNLRGLPERGGRDWFPREGTNACGANVELESRGSASCDGPQFLLKTNCKYFQRHHRRSVYVSK